MAHAGIGDSLEGIHAVDAAVRAGRVFEVVVESGRAARPPVSSIVDAARSAGAAIEVVDDVRPFASTGAPQGIVAHARPIAVLDIATLVASADGPAGLLVLDRAQDPRNVGAAARSAAAAGLSGLVVAERRAAPLGAVAFKAAAGALEQLSVAVVGSIAETIARLKQLGLWAIGLDAGGDRSLFELDLLDQPTALVLGAEGKGLSRLVVDRLDAVARIPLAQGVESLNVSAAATLAAFELARARGRIT